MKCQGADSAHTVHFLIRNQHKNDPVGSVASLHPTQLLESVKWNADALGGAYRFLDHTHTQHKQHSEYILAHKQTELY